MTRFPQMKAEKNPEIAGREIRVRKQRRYRQAEVSDGG